MATYTDIYKNLGVKLIVNQTSQNIANNTSVVSWYLYAYKISSHNPWNNLGQTPFKATINGSVVYNSNASYDLRGSTTQQLISSGTSTITHTADGTKSIAVEGYANYTSTGYGYGAVTAKGSLSLTSIPRVSVATLNTASFNFGQNVTLTTNRSSSSFTHSVFYVIGTTEYSLATGVGDSTTIAVPTSVMSSYPSAASASMVIRTKTFNGTTQIGTSNISVTVNVPSSIIPTIGSVAPSEMVAAGNIFNVNDEQYIRGISKLKATAGSVAGSNGSTIKSYNYRIVDANGKVVTGTETSSTSGVHTYGTFSFPTKAQGSAVYKVQCRVLDSRNRYSSWRDSKVFRVHYYEAPTINLTGVMRSGASNTSIIGNRTYNVYSLKEGGTTERNTGTFAVKYREKGNSTWIAATGGATGLSLNNSSATLLTGAPVNKFYEIQATVTDKIGSAFSSIISVASESVTMEILKGNSVGIGIAPPSGTRDLYVGAKGMLNYGDTTSRGNFISEGLLQANTTANFYGMTRVVAGEMYNQSGMGGLYLASTSNVGAIVLTMPSGYNGMFSATVNIRSYTYSASFEVSGYTYTASTTGWHSDKMIGNILGGNIVVRFRHNGGNGRYISIGELSTEWGSYLQVTVENAKSGFGGPFPGRIGVALQKAWPGNAANNTYFLRPLFNTANDGSGSGLDADLLDGKHAADIVTAEFNNSNGYSLRFADGVQIIGGKKAFAAVSDPSVVFAQSFAATPNVSLTVEQSNRWLRVNTSITSLNNSGLTASVIDFDAKTVANFILHYTAIGRWKAVT